MMVAAAALVTMTMKVSVVVSWGQNILPLTLPSGNTYTTTVPNYHHQKVQRMNEMFLSLLEVYL